MKTITFRKRIIIVALCVMSLAFWLASGAYAAKDRERDAPAFTITNLDGKEVSLEDYKDDVVILTFWATWCGACHKQVPALREIHKNYSGKGVTILAVSLDFDNEKRVREFVKEEKIDYPILLGTLKLAERYGIRGIPATWIIDKQGRLYKRFLGPRSYKDLEKALTALL